MMFWIMISIGLLMLFGSIGWSVYDIVKRSRQRQRDFDAQLAEIRRKIESGDDT